MKTISFMIHEKIGTLTPQYASATLFDSLHKSTVVETKDMLPVSGIRLRTVMRKSYTIPALISQIFSAIAMTG